MGKNAKKSQGKKNKKSFVKEYEGIFNNSSNNSVVINTEWSKKGDYFRKFSMYDDTYVPIKTLGSTTFIKRKTKL